jgi:Ser-tRNA(Ala) deacylase AlaX
LLPEGHELKPGDKVRIDIDWNRRYRLMRLHFAAELILELVYHELDMVEKIGAHISPVKRTGEVGKIVLKRKNIGKGKERIEVYTFFP